MANPMPSSTSRIDRALRFLERDPLLNYSAAHALLHGGASVVGMAESGEALVGVAVAGRSMGAEPAPVHLEAIGPVALRRLLSTLPRPPRCVSVHRTWLETALTQEIGPLRFHHSVEIFAGEPRLPDRAIDTRVQPLTLETIEVLRAQSAAWNLVALADHLGRGGQVLGVLRDGALIAHAAFGLPVGSLEEISHVYTAPAWRGQGLAQAMTLVAMRAIAVRGRRPLYRSRTGNAASCRVAERCGLGHVAGIRELTVLMIPGRVRPVGKGMMDRYPIAGMDKERR
ncbi:MAG: GNAT family N-acetyltransferase [Chloroflexota bacterium]